MPKIKEKRELLRNLQKKSKNPLALFPNLGYNTNISPAEVVERQTRMLQAHVPVGCEGSNPFLRILKVLS